MQHTLVRYTVRRLGVSSFLKFGFILGAAASLFPSLVATLGVLGLASVLRRFLEGTRAVTRDVPMPLINVRVTFDFVDLLHLSGTVQTLQWVDDNPWLFGGSLFLSLTLGSALTLAIATLVAAVVYNVVAKGIGGLEIQLEEAMPRH